MGMKLTESVQVAPGARVVEQVLAASVKPAPLRVVEVMGKTAVPALLRVKTWAGAVVFAGTLPKVTVAGVRAAWGIGAGVPVPLSAELWVPTGSTTEKTAVCVLAVLGV